MKPSFKIVSAASSPERANLAAALAEAAPLRDAVDRVRGAAEKARGQLASALGAVPACERAMAAARARAVADPDADRTELRALRQAVTDAADDLALARDVSERAETALVEAERNSRYASEKVEKAADAVIASNYDRALEAAEQAGRAFAKLAFAAGIIGASGNHWSGERERMVGRVETLNPHFVFRNDTDGLKATRQAAQAPWHAARAALLTDPDAALPVIGA